MSNDKERSEFSPRAQQIAHTIMARLGAIYQKEPYDQRVVHGQVKKRVGVPAGQELEEASLARRFDYLVPLFETKGVLPAKALQYLEKYLSGRPDFLTQEQKQFLARYWCVGYYYGYQVIADGRFDLFYHELEASVSYSQKPSGRETGAGLNLPALNPSFLGNQAIEEVRGEAPRHWSRGESKYPLRGEKNLSDLAGEIIGQRGRVRVLDIGMGDGYFLDRVKQRFGSLVLTTGVDKENIVIKDHRPDDFYAGPAEILPGWWGNRFDLVTSNMAWQYFLFPEKTLGEIIRVLGPGGEAHLAISKSFYYGYGDLMGPSLGLRPEKYADFVAQNFAGFSSPTGTKELAQKICADQGVRAEVEFDEQGLHICKFGRIA